MNSLTLRSIIYKLILTGLLSAIVLPMLTDMGFGSSLMFGLVLGAILYLVGDLLVLNYLGNMIAIIVDGGTAAIAARYVGASTAGIAVSWSDAIIYGVIIGIAEYFFHSYLNRRETSSTKHRS